MIDNISFHLKKLENWLESWKQTNGSYNGLISTFWESSEKTIAANGVHQAPIINGYLNIYDKTHNQTFLGKAIEAADFLLNDFDKNTFQYNSLFADIPKKIAGPILNIECNLALLRIYKDYKQILNNPNQYLDVVINNTENYLLKNWWNGKVWNNYVANQIAKGVELFLELYKITSDNKYLDYAISGGKWLLKKQIKHGYFKGAFEQSDCDSRLITVYEAACLPSLYKLYKLTNNIKYKKSLDLLSKFIKKIELANGGFIGFFEQSFVLKLSNLIGRRFSFLQSINQSIKYILINSPISKLFFISHKSPIFIARNAEIILNIINSNKADFFTIDDHVNFIIKHQTPSGGIENIVKLPLSDQKYLWASMSPIMRWNAFVFELFSQKMDKQDYTEKINQIAPYNKTIGTNIQIYENQTEFGIIIKNNKIIFNKNKIDATITNIMKKDRYKLLIVAPIFPPQTGGCATRMGSFAEFLNKDNLDIQILTSLCDKTVKNAIPNVKINRIPLFVSFKQLKGLVITKLWLIKYFFKNPKVIVLVTMPPGLHAWLTVIIAKIFNKKIIADLRDPWIEGEILSGSIKKGGLKHIIGIAMEKSIYRTANKITSVYQSLIDDISIQYKISVQKMIWIPNGINPNALDDISKLSIETDLTNKTIFVYQGLMAIPQGTSKILDFVSAIIKKIPNAYFVFIGDGEEKDKLIKESQKHEFNKHFLFLDRMSHSEVMKWVDVSDYGIVTLSNGFKYAIPSKTFDHVIFKKPIIAIAPIDGELDKLIKTYDLGINLLKEPFRELPPISLDNAVFKDYSRKDNAEKLLQIINLLN